MKRGFCLTMAAATLLAACGGREDHSVGDAGRSVPDAQGSSDAEEKSASDPLCESAPAGAVTALDVWARPAPSGRSMTAAYMTICNRTDASIRLTGATSAVAGVTELHETRRNAEGVASMAPIEGLDIAAGESANLEPGGAHVMLMQLRSEIAPGAAVPLTLTFADGQEVNAEAEARPQ